MRIRSESVHRSIAAILPLILSGFCALALAHSGGGGSSGGGHGGGGGIGGGGGHGHGGHRSATYRNGDLNGGRYGSWRGGGGYGWYTGRFYGGAGPLGYGLLFGTLPSYCETYQWGGAAYYYADNNYYQWNSSVGAYETVQPPPGLVDQVQAQAPAMHELFIFTEAGQSNEQLARDREDCQRLAAKQTGFDPRAAGSTGTPANPSSADAAAAVHEDYLRADAACLMARNYSVE
jgi:hypothetical protein